MTIDARELAATIVQDLNSDLSGDHEHLRLAEDRQPNTVWWRGEIPLTEIALVAADGGPAGYLLLSTDERLPPVLEFATEGPTLTEQVRAFHAELRGGVGSKTEPRIIFVTSTELYVEEDSGESGKRFVHLPDGAEVPAEAFADLERNPEALFDAQETRETWNGLASPGRSTPDSKDLPNKRPVRYNQNYDRYPKSSSSRTAGCVAVAWAMLLAGWKRSGRTSTEKIWPKSTCWDAEWAGAMSPNPSKCPEVNTTIWRLHKLLNTGADGNTASGDLLKGSAIFGELGIPFKYGRKDNPDFAFNCSVINANQHYVWRADGSFGLLAQESAPVTRVGHAVCVYGYKRSTGTLLISLGWGSGNGRDDKHVAYSQFTGNACFFATGLRAAESVEDGPARDEI